MGWHEGGGWNNRPGLTVTGCVCVSRLNSPCIHTEEGEGYRYCVAWRIVSLPLYQTPSRSYPQPQSGGPGLFHCWLWQRNGARGLLLLVIRADAWLSSMPDVPPNRDYVVPGWLRQKKKGHCGDLCFTAPSGGGGYLIICELALRPFAVEVKWVINMHTMAYSTGHCSSLGAL